MQLSGNTKIAGWKTVDDWNNIKLVISDFGNSEAWENVFKDYFKTRLDDRYFNPILSIKENGSYSGEGFAIMTIICSLIEFLESTYQGKNYKFFRKGDPPLNQFEYNSSSIIFNSFLENRLPFKLHFDSNSASEFYINIRCGLLHEARTNGKWTIWGASGNGKLIEIKTNEVVIYRDEFFEALILFINEHYKKELLNSDQRKAAFIRKFDALCKE